MVGDKLTVVFGQQKFAPVQYHIIDIGPFTVETTVKPGETDEQAYARAYTFLEAQAKKAFKAALPEFLTSVKEAATAVRGGR
jgi:hypothetical protein